MEKMEALKRIYEEEPLFMRLKRVARYEDLDKEQQAAYRASLKVYRDNYAILKTERAEGRVEGIEIGKEEERIRTMHMLQDSGFSIERIAELYKIPVTEVKRLLSSKDAD